LPGGRATADNLGLRRVAAATCRTTMRSGPPPFSHWPVRMRPV